MAFDIKDQLKEHKKILLPGVGILIFVLLIGLMYSKGLQPFEVGTDITGGGLNSILDDAGNISKNNKYTTQPTMQLKNGADYFAVIKTEFGNITVDLFEKDTPVTVNNFVFLSKDKFYDGLNFHRVVKSFVIQGGDPKGDGTGGPGYRFKDEIDADALGLGAIKVGDEPYLRSLYSSSLISQNKDLTLKEFYEKSLGYTYTPGYGSSKFAPYVLAMANSGPTTNGSQFFITTRAFSGDYLNGKHTVFGKVTEGYDVVDSIEAVNVKQNDIPTSPVVINSIQIVER